MLDGIDTASYQKGIVPAKLTSTDFVIVKFTQGTDYINPYANQQYSGAKSAKKLLGAYHYAEGVILKKKRHILSKQLETELASASLPLTGKAIRTRHSGAEKMPHGARRGLMRSTA